MFSAIDILCNNAGAIFGVPNGVQTYDEDAWIKTVDVNLLGAEKELSMMVFTFLGKSATLFPGFHPPCMST